MWWRSQNQFEPLILEFGGLPVVPNEALGVYGFFIWLLGVYWA